MTKRISVLLLVIASLLAVQKVKAQQDPLLTFYMFNKLYYNPGYAGMDGLANFSLTHRDQWTDYGMPGAPNTTVMSFHAPLLRYESGVGIQVVRDELGPQNNLDAQLTYAYHLTLGEGKLSLGLRAGVFAQTLDWDKYEPIDEGDPVIKSGRETQMKPDMAFGAYYHTDKWFSGISINHLMQPEFDFGLNGLKNPLEYHMYLMGGYHWEVNYDLTVTPILFVRTDMNQYQVEFSAMGEYKDRFWGGLAYRQSESLSAMIGANLLKDNSLKLGWAFDFVVPSVDGKGTNSNEVMLSYSLPVVLKGSKPIIRTPRYRKK